MLELYGIKKNYPVGDGVVEALKGIDLRFDEKGFAAVLGPSGCGKTTLLNIIGGLDHYSEGDLVINGRSTKEYKDRDWDAYRNHSIGFVFQTYNLIPHQTVLSNVELALTLAGVSKAERREAAKRALEEVGLGSQLKKKPAQMSGGQMQRVAIARALVNDPDIILADEPTGALDTETSVQIMEILRKVSEKHLVVMVTHNRELAETYATRIIQMLDGRIISDSVNESAAREPAEVGVTAPDAARAAQSADNARPARRKKKPSMSVFTALMLSLNNLLTKKGRTILTSFAGSIGIIGIALIYSVSSGTNRYIDHIQEDTLSSYPIVIESKHTDISELLKSISGSREGNHDHENDAVYQRVSMYNMVNTINNMNITENDLGSFKKYLDREMADPGSKYRSSISGLRYSYDVEVLAYTKNIENNIVRSDTAELMTRVMTKFWGTDLTSAPGRTSNQSFSMLFSGSNNSGMWEEMLPGLNGEPVSSIILSQYDLVYGSWPSEKDEVVLVLDRSNELSDLVLYALGVKTSKEIDDTIDAAFAGEQLDTELKKWSYEELCGREFRVILNSDCFIRDESGNGRFSDIRNTDAGLRFLYNNGLPVKICGIIKPSENTSSPMLRGDIGYTYMLTDYIISKTAGSPVAEAQLKTPGTDIFTGLPFENNIAVLSDAEKAAALRTYIDELDTAGKAATYVRIVSTPTEEQISGMIEAAMAGMSREIMEEALISGAAAQAGMSEAEIRKYLDSMSDEDIFELIRTLMTERVKTEFAQAATMRLKGMTDEELAGELELMMPVLSDAQAAMLYETALEFSDTTLEDNLKAIGSVDKDVPSSVSIYTSTFAGKDKIKEMINKYNDSVEEYSVINYTDAVGILMSSITTIINSISFVLIAFVAISLIVSSIMIGVITLISVQERTKEIGILRSLGASKRNVAGMFLAETVIIGFISGVLGVTVSWLLILPLNAIIHHLTKMTALSAFLPFGAALVLILISMVLTAIAGLIPSGSAARKDPVEALRTE
ncbi:MAG: ABC transporter ATP-binding protein/permease [Clostridia bacterium]|nr:ABC transporter ATP-binding protein/permease [Clostridia bacterium]